MQNNRLSPKLVFTQTTLMQGLLPLANKPDNLLRSNVVAVLVVVVVVVVSSSEPVILHLSMELEF